jgi:peptidoglycan/LPS O-acetylase OafA/YrhL
LFITGGAAGVLGGAVAFGVWLIATFLGVSDQVNVMGQGMQALQWYQFIVFGMFSGFGGGAVAGVLRNNANGPRTFTIISVIVLILSFATPLVGQGQTELATKIVLLATHVIVFFAVVPTLRQRMA